MSTRGLGAKTANLDPAVLHATAQRLLDDMKVLTAWALYQLGSDDGQEGQAATGGAIGVAAELPESGSGSD